MFAHGTTVETVVPVAGVVVATLAVVDGTAVVVTVGAAVVTVVVRAGSVGAGVVSGEAVVVI